MQSNPPPRGKWPNSRPPENANPQGYNTFNAERNEPSVFRSTGSAFNVNQPSNTDGGRGSVASVGRNPANSLRPRYPDTHSAPSGSTAGTVNQGLPFQLNVPAPRHGGNGGGGGVVAGDNGGITLPPPRSAQMMAANGAATSYTSASYGVRAPAATPLQAGRWPAAGASSTAHTQAQPLSATGGGIAAGGSLYTRLADSSTPKTGPRDAGALSYAVSDGDGTRGFATGSALGSPAHVHSGMGNASRHDNLPDISALLRQVDDGHEALAGDARGAAALTEPVRVEGCYDGGARREPSAFTFTTSSEFSTALYPGGASGPNAIASLSTVPNAFSTRPDASATGNFHSPFSTGTTTVPSGSAPLFSLLTGAIDDSQGGPSQRTVDGLVASSFTTGPAAVPRPSYTAHGGLFAAAGSPRSDGGESSEGEGLLDFRAVLGSPSAEPEDTPTTTPAPKMMESVPLHLDPVADPSLSPKPTMAEALFKHATKPANVIPATGISARPEPAAAKAASAASGTPAQLSTNPNTPPTKPSLATPAHPDSQEHPSVPAPRSAERASVSSAPRSTGREDSAFASRTSTLPQSPHTPGANRPQRQPLESPNVTRHNIARLFRDSPQSHRHREVMQQNRQKATALHRQPSWPPTNAAEVEALLKKTNAGKLVRHLAIIFFSRQNVKGVQELFDTWTRNGIPAPDLGFGAYYYYVKERSEKLLCMKHNGRGATPGHGYGKCDFESRRPNSTCRYEHVCLFCRSREHGWFEESRCEGYQQLLAEVERLGVSEEDLEVMLDAMEKSAGKQVSWNRRS